MTTTTAPARHRWALRGAVLAALAAGTILGPLTGGANPAVAAPVAAPGVAEALVASAAELPAADALSADPAAATRAVTTASRDHLREALQCPVVSEANGTLSAVMGGEQPTPTLVMPVAEGQYRITSGYGYRSYPFRGMHEGTDFAGSLGTALYAVADGTVVYSGGGRDGRSGQIIIIRAEVDGVSYDFWYGHMYTSGVYVSAGEQVVVGQKIGAIGNNGNSTGPHLHFEVHNSATDQTVDPLSFLRSHGAEAATNAARCA